MNDAASTGAARPVPLATERRGDVALLWLDRAPANALDAGLIAALGAALAAAGRDAGVAAVLIAARGPVFSAGADPEELRRVKGAALPGLCLAIEAMGKPVVAVLQGNCLGAGLELALAAHGRIAAPVARLGLPEVALGLVPGAGGTQRLPRLIGAEGALRLLMQGNPITAAEALAAGLVDEVAEDRLIDRALVLARRLAAAPLVPAGARTEGLRDGKAWQLAVAEARKRAEAGRMPAPLRMVECVEAAQLLPFDAGLAFERAAFEDMAESPEAQGLMHAFLAERQAIRPPAGVAGQGAVPASVGIWGTAGTAAELARMALSAGLRVVIAAPDRAELVPGLGRIAARQEELVAAGQLTPSARDADWGRLTGATDAAALDGVDLVLVAPGADAGALGGGQPQVALSAPGGVALYPATAPGGLAEVVAGADADPAALALAHGLARRLGGRVIASGPGGPIDRRLRAALSRLIAVLEQAGTDRAAIAAALAFYGIGAGARSRLPAPPAAAADVVPACLAALACEGLRMVEEGVARRAGDVDAAATLSGLFPRWEGGPMYQADRRGLMVLRADLRARAAAEPQLFTPPALLDRLIAAGRGLS